jgi:hypothetical protein
MGLITKISAKEFSNSFAVYDCTGAYASGSNTGGWGIPNPKIENVTEDYIEVYPPNTTSPYKINLYDTFPTTDCQLGYEITPSMVGNTYIVSGQWKIVRTTVGTDNNGISYTKKAVCLVVFTQSARCCVDKMLKNVTYDSFKDKKKKLALELDALLNSIERTKDCLPTGANDILEFINLQCQCCGCVS